MAALSTKDKNHFQTKTKPTLFEDTDNTNSSAQIDYTDTVDIKQDNVTDLYNNPATFSDRMARPSPCKFRPCWGMPRMCLFLSPAFSIEFCRVFAAMFILVQGVIHSTLDVLPLLLAGLIGLALTISTARFYKHERKLTKRKLLMFFCLYHVLVFVGTSLIAGSSWSDLFYEDDMTLANKSTSIYYAKNDSSFEFIRYDMPTPPLLQRLLSVAGYVILSSTTGSGQYIILCLTAHVVHGKAKKHSTTAIVVLTAAGACTAAFVGVVDMVSGWCPSYICPSHVTAQAAVLSSSILCLLPIGLTCCLVASYGNVILYRLSHLCHTNDLAWNTGRRSTRTAQEIFDECAALLQDYETSFSSIPTAGNSNATEENEQANPAHRSRATTKWYPHQITKGLQEPNLRKMLRNKGYLAVITCIFLLSCSVVICQFYSSLYLSQAMPVSNRTGLQLHVNVTDGVDWRHLEAPVDVRHVIGLKINGLALFLSNGIFIILYLKRKTLYESIKSEWKLWAVPGIMLVVAILACITGATHNIVPFLVMSCVLGFAKVAETTMLHTAVAQCTRTWPPVFPMPADAPTTLLWSLIPLSLVISSAAITIVQDWIHNSPPVPIYSIGVFSFLAGLSVLLFRTKVI